jgi:type I restriction enzyme M protein
MANSAGDARGSELEIRKKLIQSGAVDVIVSIGSNFFYTVTLPCTLWFFDQAKARGPRKDKVLFLDARPLFKQVTRAIREFAPEQLEFLANVVRLYRGQVPEFEADSKGAMGEWFAGKTYVDVAGLCKAATLQEIEVQGWSLNPGRYVGVGERAADGFDFVDRLEQLHEELELLNVEATDLQARVAENVVTLLDLSQ